MGVALRMAAGPDPRLARSGFAPELGRTFGLSEAETGKRCQGHASCVYRVVRYSRISDFHSLKKRYDGRRQPMSPYKVSNPEYVPLRRHVLCLYK